MITGRNKCVGYCKYKGHPGFLTELLRKKHECISKGCYHYVHKNKKDKIIENNINDYYVDLLRTETETYEGLKVIKVSLQCDEIYAYYITISNDYCLNEISENIGSKIGITVKWKKLNYTFENCIKLLIMN